MRLSSATGSVVTLALAGAVICCCTVATAAAPGREGASDAGLAKPIPPIPERTVRPPPPPERRPTQAERAAFEAANASQRASATSRTPPSAPQIAPEAARTAAADANAERTPKPPATEWDDPQRIAALEACVRTLAGTEARIARVLAPRRGICGHPAMVELKALKAPTWITFKPAIQVNCAMVPALAKWLATSVMPAAEAQLAAPVTSLRRVGGYACRNRNGAATGRISEHAFGNAFDIGEFRLADGRKITVFGAWGKYVSHRPKRADDDAAPQPAAVKPGTDDTEGQRPQTSSKAPRPSSERAFLERIHKDACGMFGTVLGPDANAAHRDHLHLDLAKRRRTAYCR